MKLHTRSHLMFIAEHCPLCLGGDCTQCELEVTITGRPSRFTPPLTSAADSNDPEEATDAPSA